MSLTKPQFITTVVLVLLAGCSSTNNENSGGNINDMSSAEDFGNVDMSSTEDFGNVECHSRDSESCTVVENCGKVTAFRVMLSQVDNSCVKGEPYKVYCSIDEVPSMPIRYFKETSNSEPAQVIWLNNSYDAPPNDGEWTPCPGSMSESVPEECFCVL